MSDLDVASLGRWLENNVAGFASPFTVSKFANGQSNPTYRIDAASGIYALRRKPFGPLLPSAHAIDREYRLIAALGPAGLPVPRAHAMCANDGVIGSAFYVMDFVDGSNYLSGTLPSLDPAGRRALYFAMIDTLARLHTVDPVAVGLGDYGRHDNYFGRQVARWTRQYRASQTESVPAMERLIEWLPTALPLQERVAIVHGDYRIDNLIFGEPTDVRAVLDWELSTLGDPLADLSYFTMSWLMPTDGRAAIGGLDLEALGIPSFDEMVRRYCAGTGRDRLPSLDWHLSFNQFRLASILQGIKRRLLEGNASNPDALVHASRVEEMADRAWSSALRAGAPR